MKGLLTTTLLLLTTISTTTLSAQEQYSFRDTTLTIEARLENLISNMKVEEKIDLLSSYQNWYLHPCERLGIPAFLMTDGALGVASWGEFGKGTAYPSALSLAASWNRSLARELGEMYAQEFRSRGIHFLLSPGVNIYRSSRSARNFEYYGEDPYLASQIVVPFIKGVQDGGVIATVKHFAGNEQEFDRYRVSSEISQRALREIYLPAFEAAVKEAGVRAVMTGYNPLNGVFCTENQALMDILKEEWGFRYMLMSDWSCVHSERAIYSSLDLEMGSNRWLVREKMMPLYESGELSIDVIDEKVRRIYRACLESGFFDRPQKIDTIPLFNPKANLLAYKAACDGMVLLRNECNILPLDNSKIERIAVIGAEAITGVVEDAQHTTSNIIYGGGGSSRVNPWYVISPLQGIIEEFPEAEVLYAEGISSNLKSKAFRRGGFVNGMRGRYYTENRDSLITQRVDHTLNFEWDAPVGGTMPFGNNFCVEWEGEILPQKSDSLTLFLDIQGGCRLWIDENLVVDALDSSSYLSEQIEVVAERGEKISIRLEYNNRRATPSEVRLGYIYSSEVDFSQAKLIASKADVVILCGGLNGAIEREGHDRPFELPFGQEALIKEISEINSNLIVALTAGGAVECASWLNNCKGLIFMPYSGQEVGRALSHILSGRVNPSGRLPFSWERHMTDSPSYAYYDQTRHEGKVYYREGIFVGYRGYDKNQISPLFAFGEGLSYTQFKISDLKILSVDSSEMSCQIECRVKNIGLRSGAEVIQLYVHDIESNEPRPVKELKGFEKVWLDADEECVVRFELDRKDFSYYYEEQSEWVAERGKYEIWIGNSSREITQRESIEF